MTSGTDPGQPARGVDLVALLRQDHRRVSELFDDVARTPLTDGTRTLLVEDASLRLQRHVAAEQEYLDPIVQHEVPGGLELAAGADAERAELTSLLREMQGLDGSHPRL